LLLLHFPRSAKFLDFVVSTWRFTYGELAKKQLGLLTA
jgi:hypothetical protein